MTYITSYNVYGLQAHGAHGRNQCDLPQKSNESDSPDKISYHLSSRSTHCIIVIPLTKYNVNIVPIKINCSSANIDGQSRYTEYCAM